MNILFISTKSPYPIVDGQSLRTYNLIKRAGEKFGIFLLTFLQNDHEVSGISHLKEFCKEVIHFPISINMSKYNLYKTLIKSLFSVSPFVKLKYQSDKMREYIEEVIGNNKIDIVHLDLLPLSQYREFIADIPVIMVDHNVESSLVRRRINQEKYPQKLFYYLEWMKLKKYEAKSLERVHLTIAMSERDKKELKKLCPKANIEIVENGVDTEYFHNNGDVEEENTLVFVGGLNWFPNYDGIKYFSNEIMPIIQKELPNAKLKVIGQLPKKLNKINKIGIEFTGFVEDDRPYIGKSAIFIVPLRIGGGTRLKILNALSVEKAIVSTTIGCEGLDVKDGENILIADEPKYFAEAVTSLLKSPWERKRLGENGRSMVKRQYDWDIISKKMNKIYADIVENNNKKLMS